MSEIVVGGVELPSPVAISIGDEIIWSSNTGRSASGLMTGDVIAQKQTYAIKWGILTQDEVNIIENKLTVGFFSVKILNKVFNAYRSTISKTILGTLSDGITYYSDVSVSLIEQ